MTKPVKILLVDNYDSFTFNLVHLIGAQDGVDLDVVRNDDDFLPLVKRGNYQGAVIGPGPGSPDDEAYFGYNRDLILEYGTNGLPVYGVCLGFQGIYHCFGGGLTLGEAPVHGKTSPLEIVRNGMVLDGVPNRCAVMRYHSILADTSKPVPDDLEITSYVWDEEKDAADLSEPMSLEHKKHPIYGVQYHPESFATKNGHRMMANFIKRCRD